jgi:N12 class adenine-specific DNA methylase
MSALWEWITCGKNMAIETGTWRKMSPREWIYITSAAAQLHIKFNDRDNVKVAHITTAGHWYVTKTCLDELVDALTHLREEVYGKRNLP